MDVIELIKNDTDNSYLPKLLENDYFPFVSVVTTTYNRHHIIDIAVFNWKNFVYPSDKIEWIILDDSPRDSIKMFKKKLPKDDLANGSPIGDTMPCLMALGASLVLRRGDKTRKVLLDNFYTGMKKNVMEPGEFIEAIELPKPVAGLVFRAHKVSKRFEQDISATCAAISYTLQGGKLSGVKLAYNGLAPSPCRAPKLEAVLEGMSPSDVKSTDLDAAIAASFTARDGLRATWAYRALVSRNLVLEFIEEQS